MISRAEYDWELDSPWWIVPQRVVRWALQGLLFTGTRQSKAQSDGEQSIGAGGHGRRYATTMTTGSAAAP